MTTAAAYAVPGHLRDRLFVSSFELHLKAANKKPATLDTYIGAVCQFGAFLAERGMPTSPRSITREHIEEFIAWLLESRQPATANNRYRGLQAYFKWLVEDGEITDNPMAKLHPPAIPPHSPEVLSDEEIKRMLKACEGQGFEERRDYAILRLLLDTGMRRGELAGIMVDDLDLQKGTVRVTGKGSRTRTVSFGNKTAVALDRYRRARSEHRCNALPNFWLGLHGPMQPNGVYQVVENRAKKAGVKAYTHLFRHTNAHLWLSSEGSEVGLMAHMGWNSRTMLQRYGASRLQERAREEHKRLGVGDRY